MALVSTDAGWRILRNVARLKPSFLNEKLSRLDSAETSKEIAERLIDRAELQAELTIAWLRLIVGLLFLPLVFSAYEVSELGFGPTPFGPYIPSLVTIGGFGLTSVVAFTVIATGRYRPRYGLAFAIADVATVVLALAEGANRNSLSGNDLFMLASAWIGPLVLAFNALRYRPEVVALAATLYVAGGLAVAYWAGVSVVPPPPPADFARFAQLPPNALRLAFIVLTGFTLSLVAYRMRRLLVRALNEQRERSMLTRFLPAEIVRELTRPASKLSEGVNLLCTILFVDLRGSMRLAESMPPQVFADFLTRFRRRVAGVVTQHGGVVDKFVGDGAMIVFGAPEPRPDDARLALACARGLVSSVDRWNARRNAVNPLSIAVGIHSGMCFCGVVGEGSRVEFTIVGDAVNVAARLEQIAKQRDASVIVSSDTLVRAGESPDGEWRPLGAEQLRGHVAPIHVYAYRAGGRLDLLRKADTGSLVLINQTFDRDATGGMSRPSTDRSTTPQRAPTMDTPISQTTFHAKENHDEQPR